MDESLPCQADGSENFKPDNGEAGQIYALKLGGGLEFAEFEPSQWRLTVIHVLGVSRQANLGYAEAYLLEYLLKHAGEMLSRQELIDYAWRDRVVSQGSLNQAISNLRALLGDDQKREIILTVPRHGYQLNGDVIISSEEWLIRKAEMLMPPASDSAASVDLSLPLTLPTSQRDWKFPLLSGLTAMLFAILIAGGLTRYFYALFPPYAMEQTNAERLQLTLVAKDQRELQFTKNLLLPVFKRMELLGGGKVLVSRTHHYIEFNCLRSDGTMHSLRVHQERISALEDNYLLECLK